jgi:hypothetical protein
MTEGTDDAHGAALFRVAVRLPPFWPDRPALWFAQAEAQFELAAITRQKTKFSHVVAQLSQQHAAEVEDIITFPPEQEPYTYLKSELIRRLSTSREQRVRQLLSHEKMGDRMPSQFLRHLKGLAPDVPDDFLPTIWASRLPPHVQAILAGQTEGSLDSASQLADRICEVTPLPATASVTPAQPDINSALLERIEELSRQVAALRAAPTRSRSRSREHQRNHRRQHTPANSQGSGNFICWYHSKYKDAAFRCYGRCTYRQGNAAGGR